MPTGYTSGIADGKITTLRQYALSCARGMGALIMMRDDPWDAQIPERFEPNTKYHDEKLVELRAEIDLVSAMTIPQAAKAQSAEIAKRVAQEAKRSVDRAAQRRRYETMIDDVEGWATEAEGLREFMLQQLRQSIDFDCKEYASSASDPVEPSQWLADRMRNLAKDIGYHEQERASEVARTESRNRWIVALRASLPAEAA